MVIKWIRKLACAENEDDTNITAIVASVVAAGTAIFGGLFGVLENGRGSHNGSYQGPGQHSVWHRASDGFFQLRHADRIVRLDGDWSFSPGDDPSWADPAHDDSQWAVIDAGQDWERQGFAGHDGFAWYRIRFELKHDEVGQPLYLRLGRVDDTDETFFNGVKIGATGQMPPEPQTGWDAVRVYRIPSALIQIDSPNVVAVRVHDQRLQGGLVSDRVGVYSSRLPAPLLDLRGMWEIAQLGDAAAPPLNGSATWQSLVVPGFWDSQGWGDFDGTAWYRLTFDFDRPERDQALMLMLGKIDDLDVTFLNGKQIGRTGEMETDAGYWQWQRRYPLPAGSLRRSSNELLVQVTDLRGGGGIHRGPIGIMTMPDSAVYWERRHARRRVGETVWDWLLGR